MSFLAAEPRLVPGRPATKAEVGPCDEDFAGVRSAQTFAFAVVKAWWRQLATRDDIPLRTPPPGLALPALAVAQRWEAERSAAELARLDLETAIYKLGCAYATRLPSAHRSARGIFYTPPTLARRLIDQAVAAGADLTRARVLDPACGGGAFLAPLAIRMMRGLNDAPAVSAMAEIGERLAGYELDPFAAWLCMVGLDAALLPLTRAGAERAPQVVTVRDALRGSVESSRHDLVIGNPPYGRVKLTAEERQGFRRSLYGHANLYALFTHQALRLTRRGGVVAFVTPTSFLAGEYFKNLRGLIEETAPAAALDFVSARKGVFEDVLQETLLATYRRGGRGRPIEVCQVEATPCGGLEVSRCGYARTSPVRSEPWILPRSRSQAALVERLGAMRHRLSDWGYGVSTGPLVWNRHKDQLVDQRGPDCYPLIWAEAVGRDGDFAHRAEKRGHAPYFKARRGDEWLMVERPCVLLQRTTAKEQARRLIAATLPEDFVRLHGAVVVENHLNMVRPTNPAPAVDLLVVAAFFNSRATDEAFRCISGSVAVSAYELESLPLPSPADLARLTYLVLGGAAKAEIDTECDALYAGA